MAKPIQVKIRLQKEDYIRGFRSFYTHQFGNQVFIGFLLFLIVVGVLGIARSGPQPVLVLMVLIALVGLLYPYFITPIFMGRTIDRNESLLAESIWTFSDRDITVKMEEKESKLDWSALHEYVETKDSFLLVHSGKQGMFQVVPKRGFENLESERRFRDLLGTKFGTDVTSFVTRHRLTILLVIFVIAANLVVFYFIGRGT
jgi:hypothetical protein